jgi:hypothetical protein
MGDSRLVSICTRISPTSFFVVLRDTTVLTRLPHSPLEPALIRSERRAMTVLLMETSAWLPIYNICCFAIAFINIEEESSYGLIDGSCNDNDRENRGQ